VLVDEVNWEEELSLGEKQPRVAPSFCTVVGR
jgi:hypothetical protein